MSNTKKAETVVVQDSGNYDKKLYGVLAWLVLPAIYFLLSKKYQKDEYLLYHSYMALVVGIGGALVRGALNAIHMWMVADLVNFLSFVIFIYAIVKIFQEEKPIIPVLTEWVDSLVQTHMSK